ncbi:MAG: circularly permuted type 2 ATP-grasp protein [Bacteroidia bacterium]|nr:circularly permuted type 2 ATP-grasp protein [Bacteroidia bacterium]
MSAKFGPYSMPDCFDESFTSDEKLREAYVEFARAYSQLPQERIQQLQFATDKVQLAMGMTFNVYSEGVENERILPLDIIPRIIAHQDWALIRKGLTQRIKALNMFIQDMYHEKRAVTEGVIPQHLLDSCPNYLPACEGLMPPKGIWAHISGTDIIRGGDGEFYVLEDNLRVPSGVSYMLENRELLKRTYPNLFQQLHVEPVYDYSQQLYQMLRSLSNHPDPVVVVLTPGIYNSAYFEHSYLAREMGVELVEGRDLIVKNDKVYMRTTKGPKRVDVIYRRVDDIFLDPKVFRPDSMLGISGLFDAYKAGNVALANAPGTGIADDKVIYAYVPRLIEFYLGEKAIIPNVPTYICEEKEAMEYVLDNISELVVKEANASGGYGMLIGPKSGPEEHDKFRKLIQQNPRNYIAQPTISLSTVPTLVDGAVEGRHVDLRPFILYGDQIEVVPGGLTRVALKRGSLVVNSSQGGGSKDTWVLGAPADHEE